MIFTSVNVQPAYGRDTVFITWTVANNYADGDFYVYRSATGVDKSDDWEILNEDTPVQNASFYTDTTFYDKHDFRKWYYRILCVKGANEYDSPIIGMYFEALNKTEYGLLYTMRRREYLRMRQGNGVRVFHCIPTTYGDKAPAYDPVTEKNMAACSINSKYEDPFKTCFQTWSEVANAGPQVLDQLPDGGGFNESQKFSLRLLAFPEPEVGHIIVFPDSDRRFILDGNIQPYLFKGFLPVAYDVEASFLSKSDPRYAFEMPTPLSDPDYPVAFNRAL